MSQPAPNSPANPAAVGQGLGLPTSPWHGFWRRGLRNQGVCAAIAVLIWLMSSGGRGNLLTAWVYSAAIGSFSWLFIDAGRLLLAAWVPGRASQSAYARARWPGPGWMLLCILLGTTAGYTLGAALGDAITGFTTPSLLHNRAAIAISLIFAVAATWYYMTNERLRIQQAAAEAARREATESQLMLLQSQLEPHMLFNTLANLRVLITLDPPRAQAMLDRLIAYLRATLGASRSAGAGPHVSLHPLQAEFDRLDDYLTLMALRMGPRLTVVLDLPEALRTLPVPPLLLQPLVENSIRHGLEPKIEGGRIEVRALQLGNTLRLTVRDTGVGLTAASASSASPDHEPDSINPSTSTGLGGSSHYGTQHVAARLATLYGSAARFSLIAASDTEGGTLAQVDLPMPSLAQRNAAPPS